TGNHHRLDFMIGSGKALDTDRYFVVCTDAIGNGLTTSPSTSTAQPRMRFPRYTIRDMVRSQHRLLTEHLKIDHVVAVVGPSMGGMQALQWGVSHPKFMDSLVALVPLARDTDRPDDPRLRRERLHLPVVGLRRARRGHDAGCRR